MQHSTLSVIHPNAKIGNNVTISPFVTIEDDVEIGDNTYIASNAVLMSGTRVGKNCKIFPGAILGAIPQDLKFEGEHTTLEVGDNTTIREYCTLNRGTVANGKTVVGSNCLLMAYVHVAHDCIVGDNCVLANNATLAGHVEVEDFVVIGGLVAIQQFTKIGSHAMLGGGTMHNKDVPPYVRVARQPASYIGINSIGLRRRGFSEAAVQEIQDIYNYLYVSKMTRSEALAAIEKDFPQSEYKSAILNFINESKQGILKGLKL